MKLLSGNVIVVGGGKSGAGKSFLAANIAGALAKSGRKVILVDADRAGADLHALVGITHPEHTFGDYFTKEVRALADIPLPTMLPNLRLICGASDLLEIASPHFVQKQKMINDLGTLNADYLVFDLGADAGPNNLDFFNAADSGVLIATPSPASLQSAYGFLKTAVQRKVLGLFPGDVPAKRIVAAAFGNNAAYKSMKQIIDMVRQVDPEGATRVAALLQVSRYWLFVNMASFSEEQRVAKALGGVAYQFLNVTVASLGSMAYDPDVESSIRKREPLVLLDNPAMTHVFMQMTGKLLEDGNAAARGNRDEDHVKLRSSSKVQLCLHDELLFQGTKLHVQTEDLGMDRTQIMSLVFSGGRILYSRKTPYDDVLGNSAVQQAVAERVKGLHRRMLDDIGEISLPANARTGTDPVMTFRVALVGESDYMRTRLADLLRSGGFDVDLRARADVASVFDRRLHAYDVIIVSTDMTASLDERQVFESMLDTRGFLFLDENSMARGREQSFLIHPEMSPEDIIAAVNSLIFLNSNLRTARRIKVNLPVECECDGRILRSAILDLRENGLFISTLAPPPAGAMISARFALPGRTADIVANGHVAYSIGFDLDRSIILHPSSPDKKIIALPGMGIVIDEIREEDRAAVRKYIQQQF